MKNVPRFNEIDFYENWINEEKIPLIKGYHIEDLMKVSLEPWQRTGGLGAYIELVGNEYLGSGYICEIPPGGSLKPEKHLFEEIFYIVSGRGVASVWIEDGSKQTFNWQEGSFFSPPLNSWHQLFNSEVDRPARFVAVTSARVCMQLFHNKDFIFNNDFHFKDRYSGQSDYFSGEGKFVDYWGNLVWETNFVKDARSFELAPDETRGGKGLTNFELCNNTWKAHTSEFEVCTYKKAHRHGPSAIIIIISGKGYTLMWLEGQPKQKFDWREGSIIVPPENWFHQHCNTGTKAARYLALSYHGKKYRFMKRWAGFDKDIKKGGCQIEHYDEDPEIRKIFEEELSKEGLKSKMDVNLYKTDIPESISGVGQI